MILSQVQRRVRSIDGALKSKISSSHSPHWELVLPQGDAEQEGGGELLVEKDEDGGSSAKDVFMFSCQACPVYLSVMQELMMICLYSNYDFEYLDVMSPIGKVTKFHRIASKKQDQKLLLSRMVGN